jgi:hypothetical protein
VTILVLKLALTPALIGGASAIGRRFGPSVGGWLVALPWTSGPVVFVLAAQHGTRYAAAVALGSLAGALGQSAFCLAYGRSAQRGDWSGCLLASSAAFAGVAVVLDVLPLRLVPLLVGVPAVLAVSARLLPAPRSVNAVRRVLRWELPIRMALATALVLGITSLAPALGPRASGLLATYPLITAVLVVFAHRDEGSESATQVLRGLLVGLFSFAGFFVVLHTLLLRTDIGLAFAAAAGSALVLQTASLAFLRREPATPAV